VPIPASNGLVPVVRSTAKSGAPVPVTSTLRMVALVPPAKPKLPWRRIWSPVRVRLSTSTPLTVVVTVRPTALTSTVWSRVAQVSLVRPVVAGRVTVATGTVRVPAVVGLVSLWGS
jgi:hypothetical protein